MNTKLRLLNADALRLHAYDIEQKLVDVEILLKIIEEKTDEMLGASQDQLNVINAVQCLLGCARKKIIEAKPSSQSMFALLTLKISGEQS